MRIEGTRRLIRVGSRSRRAAGTESAARASGKWPARGWFLAVGAYLLVYISWMLWHWIPLDQSLVAQVILKPINAAAALMAWQTSRSVRGSRRVALAWRLISLGLFGQLAGGIATGMYSLLGETPYPSLADPLYLSFYPLMLTALVVLAHARRA
jgi:hypothetical protein